MSREVVEVDFQAAMASARELDGIADELEKALKQEYAASMAQLSRNWIGENALFYQKKGAKLTEQIENSISKIRKAADEVRRTARLLYQAELDARDIVKVRTY